MRPKRKHKVRSETWSSRSKAGPPTGSAKKPKQKAQLLRAGRWMCCCGRGSTGALLKNALPHLEVALAPLCVCKLLLPMLAPSRPLHAPGPQLRRRRSGGQVRTAWKNKRAPDRRLTSGPHPLLRKGVRKRVEALLVQSCNLRVLGFDRDYLATWRRKTGKLPAQEVQPKQLQNARQADKRSNKMPGR